ncbi:hypothetical protein Nepgr_014071 [Nepenthes gracilis]|uniref:non-specific serine/threonine protein kinase n=1 Tax=Nepenthes gracilis TaxID=150966 RepID=A0AAD3SIK2_NEPGR|nr:hypothetical protein Nepgr_014071 [Nepenthes gracilis]
MALSPSSNADRDALLALKEWVAEDPYGALNSWNESLHFCSWEGVSCSRRHVNRVAALNLGGRQLGGSLPPHIGNLTFLRVILLQNNVFGGRIPQEIGRLLRLEYLNLSGNVLEGEIPNNLSRCLNLRSINLMRNHLVGKVPYDLSNLASGNLINFSVSNNNLIGNIPSWLGNFSSLQFISMEKNNLKGNIPNELGKLKKLKLLQLSQNSLSGKVPPTIYNITSLLYLSLAVNQLHGTIPADIGQTLPNLLGLYMEYNNFTGPMPLSFPNASGLEQLELTDNSFRGTLPLNLGSLKSLNLICLGHNPFEPQDLRFLTSLYNCSSLQGLDVGDSNLRGGLPSSIGNLSSTFQMLSAGDNQISGAIPSGIGNLISLTWLALDRNSLEGEIPASIAKLTMLQNLWLLGNRISGSIPSSIGNMTQLRKLYLDSNYLNGSLPRSVGNCKNLQLLILSHNFLSGVIPKEIASLPSISISFNLDHNSFTGPLPVDVGNMCSVTEFDISNNRLEGAIPSTLGNCQALVRLSMTNNLFNGSIPPKFSTLKGLEVLDLSRNNLSGKIPSYLENFNQLQNLNLSFNNFEGEVPDGGIFRNASLVSLVGNPKLCGGAQALGLHPCATNSSKPKHKFLAIKVLIPACIAFCAFIAFVLIVLYRNKKPETRNSSSLGEEPFKKISYTELHKATNGFSTVNLIGEGSYGLVYKGVLDPEGSLVAVKVLKLKQKGASKSFMAECRAWRDIRHRHLIKIITVCSSIDSKGSDFKALVYEYMPNGNLEQWLHHNTNELPQQGCLSFLQRLNIAIGVASAMEYLHHQCQTLIIHGDLKPSNVLIDADMNARVGDLGLSKFLANGPQSASQGQTSTHGNTRGTVGYVAPEYGINAKVSSSGDVYSFGILLLEMLTEKRPTDSIFQGEMTLHKHAKMAMPERVGEIVARSLQLQLEDDNHDNNNAIISKECLVAAMCIGIACSLESPHNRMDMKNVTAKLRAIREKLLVLEFQKHIT